MGAALRLVGVSVDSADAATLAGWWADVLGGTVAAFAEAGFWSVSADALGGVNLGFGQVDQPTPGKNRLHVDFAVVDRSAAVGQLVQAGATVVYEGAWQGVTWTTLADPDGNLFDVTDTP